MQIKVDAIALMKVVVVFWLRFFERCDLIGDLM